MADYSQMTHEDFDRLLIEVMSEDTVEELLQIPGVYEAVSEHYTNDVLGRWEHEQGTKEVCGYCDDAEVDDHVDPPDVDDHEAWERLAQEHAERCEWILTRAHRLPMPADEEA